MSPAEALTQKPLWAALMLGVLLPIIGRNLVLGRTILLGLAVPQVSMSGIAFLFLGHSLGWAWCAHIEDDAALAAAGALLFAVPALVVLACLRGALLSEARLGFLYLTSLAATNLMLSSNAVGETYLSDLFHGRLLLISNASLALLGSGLGAGFFIAIALRRRILLTLTDPDVAAASGIAVARWKAGLAIVNGAVIGIAVSTAGPLVTFGFLVLPTLASAPFSGSLRTHLVLAMIFGAAMACSGFWFSYEGDFPLGDSVVAAGCVLVGINFALGRMRPRRPIFSR